MNKTAMIWTKQQIFLKEKERSSRDCQQVHCFAAFVTVAYKRLFARDNAYISPRQSLHILQIVL
jgi:hypothetical protein